MNQAKSWRLILTVLIACLIVGCNSMSRRTFRAYVALNGNGPLGITDAWSGPDAVVLYRAGRNNVICYDAFHSKSLHDFLSGKNGQRVTVEYDTFSDFGRVHGYNVHSVDGMILANGEHVLREDFAASAGVAQKGPGINDASHADRQ